MGVVRLPYGRSVNRETCLIQISIRVCSSSLCRFVPQLICRVSSFCFVRRPSADPVRHVHSTLLLFRVPCGGRYSSRRRGLGISLQVGWRLRRQVLVGLTGRFVREHVSFLECSQQMLMFLSLTSRVSAQVPTLDVGSALGRAVWRCSAENSMYRLLTASAPLAIHRLDRSSLRCPQGEMSRRVNCWTSSEWRKLVWLCRLRREVSLCSVIGLLSSAHRRTTFFARWGT